MNQYLQSKEWCKCAEKCYFQMIAVLVAGDVANVQYKTLQETKNVSEFYLDTFLV